MKGILRYVLPTLCLCWIFSACNQQGDKKTSDSTDVVNDEQPSKVAAPKLGAVPIVTEHIDGPANIRDAVNGEIIFTLDDDVKVTATDTHNGWCQVGLQVSITIDEAASMMIAKGTDLRIGTEVIGKAINDIDLYSISNGTAEIVGFTKDQNIKPNTIAENILAKFINAKKGEPITYAYLSPFIQSFNLVEGMLTDSTYKTYEMYEDWINDPSPGYRILLVFKEQQLIGIVHTRFLSLNQVKDETLELGYGFAPIDTSDRVLLDKFKDKFNDFIISVD